MTSHRGLFVLLLLLTAGLSAVVVGADKGEAEDPIRVFVGVLPQVYLADRVGGKLVTVEALISPGESPATYDPTPKDMSRLYDSDIYFKIGLPFETRLMEKASHLIDNFNIVDTRQGITLRTINDHSHGDRVHIGELDPHIWMDPNLAKLQAGQICRELSRLKPLHEKEFHENLAILEADLDRVDSVVADILAPFAGHGFFVFHPSYGYFADRYQLRQVAVETEGKEPGAKHMVDIINEAREESIRVIFVQPQFASRTAEAVAREIGGRVVELDPLAGDYLNNLLLMAERIADAFASESEKDNDANSSR